MNNQFDIQGAKKSGYSDQEINNFLSKQNQSTAKYEKPSKNEPFSNIAKNFRNFWNNFGNPTGKTTEKEEDFIDEKLLKHVPEFDVKGALESGYSPKEINEFLITKKPEKSWSETLSKLPAQLALGASEMELLPYELGVAPLSSKDAQNIAYRETISDELENLDLQKQSGQWTEEDQGWYEHLKKQLIDTEESEKFTQTADIGIQKLAEKATGLDLHPEGVLEKAARWTGFLKDPRKAVQLTKDLIKHGNNLPQIIKEAIPGFKAARGLGAGTALEMAEQEQFGPLGTLGALIIGDTMAYGPKGIFYAATHPKQAAAKTFNLFTGATGRKKISQELADTFNNAGIQIDAGTLTGSPLVQMMQSRLKQSGLVGDSLENFSKNLSEQVVSKYKEALGELGAISFENSTQISEALKEATKVSEMNLNTPTFIKGQESEGRRALTGRIAIQEQPPFQQNLLNRIAPQEFESSAIGGQNLKTAAEDIKRPIQEEFNQRFNQINEEIAHIEAGPQAQLVEELNNFVREQKGSLLLGESTAEAGVLRSAENLLNRLSAEGGLVGVSLNDLIKTKRTLGDIANWEFGGSNFESAYKKLVGDVDRAITETLARENPQLAQAFQELNSEYSQFKDMFENRNLKNLFSPKNENYNALLNEFIANPDKLRSLEDIFHNNPRGQNLINQVKRDYAQRVTDNPNATPRQFRDLSEVLGPEFQEPLERYIIERQQALEHPQPQLARREPIGINAPISTGQEQASKGLQGRAKETGVKRAEEGLRKKFHEKLLKMDNPDKVMKQMDTLNGIRELRRILNLTPEGRELFKELSRYKIAQIIDNKMKDSITGQIKHGTFAKLLENPKDRQIVKELISPEAYKKIMNLQKVSGELSDSASKFFNASKSGTTLVDMGIVGAAATGVLTGNAFLAVPAMLKIGGSYIMANLLSDAVFLKELEKAVLTNNPKLFRKYLENLKPIVQKYSTELGKSDSEIID